MKNTKFVVITPILKQYTAYEGRNKILRVISDRFLTPSEVENFRIAPHADDDDPNGDLMA